MVQVRNRVLWMATAGVLLTSLLALGGLAVHRLGWSQGYAAAEIAAAGGEALPPPLAPQGWRPMAVGRGGSLLLYLALGLLFFALASRLLRLIVWGAVAGPRMQWHAGAGPSRVPWHQWHANGPAGYSPRWACPASRVAADNEGGDPEE